MVDTTEAKCVCGAGLILVYSTLGLRVKPCEICMREDFEQVSSGTAFDEEFANTDGKTVQLDRRVLVNVTSMTRNQFGKPLLYHLRHLDADAIDAQFNGVRDRYFQVLCSLWLPLPSCPCRG